MIEKVDKNFEKAILDAAEKLFLEKGFSMTSTIEIAKEAGCNQSMVHYYFRTKDKLFDAIFENKANLIINTIISNWNSEIPIKENLKNAIEAHFEILRENPKIPFLIFNELTTNPERLKKIVDKIQNIKELFFPKFVNDLKKAIESGEIRKTEPIDFIVLLVSLNVIPFVAKPLIQSIAMMNDKEFEEFIKVRKQENVRIILKSLENN
ncbi:TetR/AcrR family transcriptional regulator [Bacteroidetes/Chlorobi group bacterium ChocPot_Mid]|nr:MAG: TetR/AcrR family transcriptional regulator [Bacteroidetes/Chlorobi group bacterium ChocPot_Mid]